jgi:hypothetical protein
MAASRSPLLADLKKAFAIAHGLTERSARRHFNAQSELWQSFISKQGTEAAKNLTAAQRSTAVQATALQILGPASPATIEKPPVVDQPDEHLAEPQRILKQQWLIYDQASHAWHRALEAGDEVKSYALGQATIKALDAYYKAKSRHDQWELDDRKKVPFSELLAIHAQFLQPVANLIRNLCAQLGPIMNPKDTHYAIRAGNEYMVATVDPQITRIIDGMEEQLRLPSAA